MSETLKYVVEDKVLAEVLGRNNFSTKESAVLELVKNAYDAGSEKLTISFRKSEVTGRLFLEIVDDGFGMNVEDIKNAWMYVGKSTRDYIDSKTGRVFAGSKGIGRFALARLGEKIELSSYKDGHLGIQWTTDWKKSSLDSLGLSDGKRGTIIRIYNLRDKWSNKSIKPLAEYLSKVYNDDKMAISISYFSENSTVKEKTRMIWNNPTIGINYLQSISLDYDSQNCILSGEVLSDEFNEVVSNMTVIDTRLYSFHLDMIAELKKEITKLILEENDIDKGQVTKEDIIKLLGEVGSFKGKLYFSLNNVTHDDKEKYEYKYDTLSERFKIGVILYRNAFSIDSFEGRTDWLELGKRASASPAAASHPTGSWRVRRNQLSGYIVIDKEKNCNIEDISNRQGIVQNIYFTIFKKIIDCGLKEFESYRQGIVRDIRKVKDSELDSSQTDENEIESKVDDILKGKKNIEDLTERDIERTKEKFLQYQNKIEEISVQKKEIEENYRYETQLLNVLATLQLKVSSLSHEIQNNRNTIAANPKKIKEALQRKYDWDELASERPSSRNIPKLLEVLTKDLDKVLDLADTIIDETKRDKFESKSHDLSELVGKVISKWKFQYHWVDFQTHFIGEKNIDISSDSLEIILDNLILNSVQINETKRNLKITVEFDYDGEKLLMFYADNGVGLDEKYKSNPQKILNVHEGTRKDGHGIGMWIVNNTIYKFNGHITINSVAEGFSLIAEMLIDSRE